MKQILTKNWLKEQLNYVYDKVLANLDTFRNAALSDVSKDYIYQPSNMEDWTDGFWGGILNLANEYRPNEKIQEVRDAQIAALAYRLENEIALKHHDLGFLYSPTAVAKYKLTKDQNAKQLSLNAAEVLMRRYQPQAQIIQAWGDLSDPEQQGRMIIDCNMNLPLLYFAAEATGNLAYYEAAKHHAKNAQKYLVREDRSTYHTYYMDTETGKPKFGKTAQGYSDDSCWARGQAWAIYGFPLSFRYTNDASFLDTAKDTADYFIEHLPEDLVSYWDLVFTDGSNEERDTSAAAIAVCGLFELSNLLPTVDPKKEEYRVVAEKILYSLGEHYTTKDFPESNGFLTQGVYAKPENKGVDECTSWGDYFYLEALIRAYQSWNLYW